MRLIITDDNGRAVGVGKRARLAPDWLREASLAIHPECLEPNCRRSARTCDLDHATAWDDEGPTDLDNIGPLCRSGHTRKDRNGWTLSPADDRGTRRWKHPRSGLVIEIPPATRRLGRDRPRGRDPDN